MHHTDRNAHNAGFRCGAIARTPAAPLARPVPFGRLALALAVAAVVARALLH